jgi:hypothetical protein
MSALDPSSPLHLLSLPTEILDHILELAFIPDRLWINALHQIPPHSVDLVPQAPFAMLSYIIPNVGSQFSVQRFSFSKLMISKALYAWLKSLLCHRTILQFGDTYSFLALTRRAGHHIAGFGFKRISLEINENAMKAKALTVEMLVEMFESTFDATLNLVEIRPAFRKLTPRPSRRDLSMRAHYVTFLGLFTVRLALLSKPSDAAPAQREVRVPFLLQEPIRQELLDTKDIDRHCDVFWTETGRDRYAGPSGFIRLRAKSTKSPSAAIQI